MEDSKVILNMMRQLLKGSQARDGAPWEFSTLLRSDNTTMVVITRHIDARGVAWLGEPDPDAPRTWSRQSGAP